MKTVVTFLLNILLNKRYQHKKNSHDEEAGRGESISILFKINGIVDCWKSVLDVWCVDRSGKKTHVRCRRFLARSVFNIGSRTKPMTFLDSAAHFTPDSNVLGKWSYYWRRRLLRQEPGESGKILKP